MDHGINIKNRELDVAQSGAMEKLSAPNLEWQIFCDKENTEKSWKLSTKHKTQKITKKTAFLCFKN